MTAFVTLFLCLYLALMLGWRAHDIIARWIAHRRGLAAEVGRRR